MDYEPPARRGFQSSVLFAPQRQQYDERDTSAPMDVDRPSYFQGEYDSPPRKRPHIDNTPRAPIFPPQRQGPAYPAPFGHAPPAVSAPFLFSTAQVSFHPGAATPVEDTSVPDIEMTFTTDGDETEREGKREKGPAGATQKANDAVPEEPGSADVGEGVDSDVDEEDERPRTRELALGGYKRVMRRRRAQVLSQPSSLHHTLPPSLTQQIFWPYPMPSAPHAYPAPTTPDYASRVWAWCRAVFNSLLLLFAFLSVSALLYSVSRDVGSRIEHHNREYGIEVQECADKRARNHCDADFVGPELRLQCLQWENCIRRDTRSLGYTKVVAQVVAEVLDEFASNVSWRMVAMFLTAAAVILIAANFKPFPAPAPVRSEPPHAHGHTMPTPSHPPTIQFGPPAAPFPFAQVQHHQPLPLSGSRAYDEPGSPRIEELDADDESPVKRLMASGGR